MGKLAQYLDYLSQQFPEYFAWLQEKPAALRKIKAIAQEAVAAGWTVERYLKNIQQSKSYQNFVATPPGEEPPPEEVPPPEDVPPPFGNEDTTTDDIRALLLNFLHDNELPESLMGFIESALAKKWSYAEIVARLRETPEYLAAYPENAMRKKNGLSWWSEARIREYRDQVRRISKEYLGTAHGEITNTDIANLIATGVDLGEFERRIQTHQAFLQWGPAVKKALELELGYSIPDERVWAFMNADIPTPELDLAYRRALMRGQPDVLGLGIRPEEEADLLIKMGFSPEQAFAGYQGIASELPRAERMQMLETYINGQGGKLPTNPLGEASQGLLFRAMMLKDPTALTILSQMYARETARFQAGGGPAGGGAGLLSPENR